MISPNWPDPSGRLSPHEMLLPSRVHPQLIEALGETRLTMKRPMYLSRLPDGTLRQPHGDAVPPWSEAHAIGSLHKYDIDHNKSIEKVVEKSGQMCRAQDWDCDIRDSETLFAFYHDTLLSMRFGFPPYQWTGIGLYPDWGNPGFHTDLRPLDHPAAHARWFAVNKNVNGKIKQVYYPLTWNTWQRVVMLRAD